MKLAIVWNPIPFENMAIVWNPKRWPPFETLVIVWIPNGGFHLKPYLLSETQVIVVNPSYYLKPWPPFETLSSDLPIGNILLIF